MQLNHKVAVVTGAGSGIGRSLAIQLAQAGCHMALSDINSAGLAETMTQVQSIYQDDSLLVRDYLVDMSDREAVYQFADNVIGDFDEVDIVINNAGVTAKSTLEDFTYEDFEWVLNINLWGVVYGTKAFLPYLKTRPEACLANISSINALVPFPMNGPYNISKSAVLAFNETLAMELQGSSVKVLSVHPGGIKTNLVSAGRNVDERFAQSMNAIFRTTADQAAARIVKAICARKSRLYIGFDAWLMQALKRIWPSMALLLSRRVIASR